MFLIHSNSIQSVAMALGLISLGIVAGGCTGVPRNAVPEHLASSASVPSMTGIRYWGDEPPANMADVVEVPAIHKLKSVPLVEANRS